MDDSRVLRGTELRYALTEYLGQHGTCSIATPIAGLTHQGFVIPGNAAKSVSDALRWEMGHCRCMSPGHRSRSGGDIGRSLYAPFYVPRSTEYRIHKRVSALRAL
ncbi:MAG TPA: hypothetical protein VF477_05880, partial [Mycobacterium sp.]